VRFYSITITNPTSGKVVVPSAFATLNLGGASYTSFANNMTYTAALDVEIDAFVTDFNTPSSDAGAFVQVRGVSLQEIQQANNLNGFNIVVKGGFQKGLPLANPAQSGVLFTGTIFQCYGNWIGTEMTLDFLVIPGNSTSTDPLTAAPPNISFNWPVGTPFSAAIQQCLQTAFPGPTYKVNVSVSPNLICPQGDQHHIDNDINSFSNYIQGLTQPIIGGTKYQGVRIFQSGNTINVTDLSQSTGNVTTVLFQDLIGQPTWINPVTIQFKCPMRADIKWGSTIKMDPKGVIATTTPQSLSQTRDKSVFQGNFTVVQMRHVGHFRSPSPDAWVTVFDAVAA
jgi:hypothetical protein